MFSANGSPLSGIAKSEPSVADVTLVRTYSQLCGEEGVGPAAPYMPIPALAPWVPTPLILPSEECQECQIVLLGGEERELATSWWTQRIPATGTSELTRIPKKVQAEPGSPTPVRYQTRNVLYVFRGV